MKAILTEQKQNIIDFSIVVGFLFFYCAFLYGLALMIPFFLDYFLLDFLRGKIAECSSGTYYPELRCSDYLIAISWFCCSFLVLYGLYLKLKSFASFTGSLSKFLMGAVFVVFAFCWKGFLERVLF